MLGDGFLAGHAATRSAYACENVRTSLVFSGQGRDARIQIHSSGPMNGSSARYA